MTSKRAIVLFLLIALTGASLAAQVANCELMDGGGHPLMSCPAGIAAIPWILGLMALSLLDVPPAAARLRLVPDRLYHPPRPTPAR